MLHNGSRFGLVFSLSGISTCTHRPQEVVVVRGYLHVLKYLLLTIIILEQKGVMQTNTLADVKSRHFISRDVRG